MTPEEEIEILKLDIARLRRALEQIRDLFSTPGEMTAGEYGQKWYGHEDWWVMPQSGEVANQALEGHEGPYVLKVKETKSV